MVIMGLGYTVRAEHRVYCRCGTAQHYGTPCFAPFFNGFLPCLAVGADLLDRCSMQMLVPQRERNFFLHNGSIPRHAGCSASDLQA